MSSPPTAGLPNEDRRRFWCHQCRSEIRPSSDFSCLGCGNDFIEEMEESSEDDPTHFVVYDQPGSTPSITTPAASPQPPQQPTPPLFAPQPQYQFQTMFGNPGMAPPPFHQPTQAPIPLDLAQMFQQVGDILQQMSAPHQQAAPAPVMQVFTAGGAAGMPPMNFQTFMQSMLSGLNGGEMVGNPGDYAFGNLDNIITRLMETAGDRGPPPAAEDVVESLPSVRISQEAVDAHEDCAICKDEYTLGEEALKLACEHRFHPTCIKEWLGRRNTCPVCRFQLKATEKQGKTNNGGSGGNNGRGPGGGRGGSNNENNSADSPFQFYM